MPEPHRTSRRPPKAAQGTLAAVLAALACVVASPAAADQKPVRTAVFDFELVDASAGGGIIAPDANDAENLAKTSDEARRLLAASGRYDVVDTAGVAGEVRSAGGVRTCGGCELAVAQRLGAEQSVAGVLTRVNRTEYTLQVVFKDARTGAVLANHFTGLRMGANYAWPRGVKWLMENKVLSARQTP